VDVNEIKDNWMGAQLIYLNISGAFLPLLYWNIMA
jgi:hypothetical protein